MPYSTTQIQHILSCSLLNPKIYNTQIQYLIFDSRKLLMPPQSIFFALEGKRHNGHTYIQDLYQKGVRNFVVNRILPHENYPNANFFYVRQPLAALQHIATHHKNQFQLKTIGITGSNGKTIVKEWLHQLLQQVTDYKIIRSPKSYNSQIGVPLSVWQIQAKHDLGIFEAGISQVGEMERLAKIIQCDIGIFTNIGTAHDEGFDSLEQKVQEKAKLFSKAHTVIYCADYLLIDKTLKNLKVNTFTWSKHHPADLQILAIEKGKPTLLKGRYRGTIMTITIPFADDASIENAIHCWATLLFLGYTNTPFQSAFQQLQSVALRLELKKGINRCTLVNDSYSLDINSLTIALDFLQQQNTHPACTLIISDMLQSGLSSKILYKQVADLLIQKKINRMIGIGKAIPTIQSHLPSNFRCHFFPSTSAFLNQIHRIKFQNESILLKGARIFEFERIANALAKQVHQTVLEINLNALAHNLNVYRNLLNPSTKVMVMVKASAYGSGSDEVAKLLEFQQVDYLAVAYTDEGVELRMAGVQLPILVLNPEVASFDSIIRYQLEPEIYSFALLHQFLEKLQQPTYTNNRPYPIHLKLDTGMRRLGFEQKDLEQLVPILQKQTSVKVQSIFSHLVGSDAPQHDDFSNQQIHLYQTMYAHLTKNLGYSPIRHILNTGGIIRFPNHQMDMVRLGLGLYGIDSTKQLTHQLQMVTTLKATISQIKQISTGTTVGYNRMGKAKQPTTIATISIGYADGFPRALSNGVGSVWLHEQEAFIMGNVCMDMCMVDITHIPQAKEGDEVIIFGEHHPIALLAQRLNTIPYEILTNFSDRVKRVYFQE